MLSIQELLNPLPAVTLHNDSASPCIPAVRPITPEFRVVATTQHNFHAGYHDRDNSLSPMASRRSELSPPPQIHQTSVPRHSNPSSPSPDIQTPAIPMQLPRFITSSLSSADSFVNIRHNVSLNRKTTLKTLFHYPLGTVVEYPETSADSAIGHLFDVSPDDWSNPRLDFIYSQGKPAGRTKQGNHIFCELLVDGNGVKVPCRELHFTCM